MQYLLTSAALVATTLAAPANIMGRSAFEVKQVEAGKILKNGPLQAMSVYEKYARVGAVAPSEVVAAASQQSGTVAANPEQYDSAYLSPVTVGKSQLNLDFDTGSSDLWVYSTLTPRSESAGHSVYDTSSGTRLQGQTWDISYGDGSSASGVVFADKVVIGGVTATRQAVEAATSISGQFTDPRNVNTDGLVGLAFSSLNTVQPQQQTTFFDTVKSTLQQAVFTADLKAGEPGSYTFGYIDSSKYTGSIAYVPVDDSNGFWQFSAGGYSIGGSGSTGGSLGTSIADTGTSLLYLPANVVQSYWSQVRGSSYNQQQAGYVFPCSANLPSFSASIGGKTFTVPGSYINFAPIDESGSTCYGGIQPNTGIGFNIFGDTFLKAVYAIFDSSQGSPRLGFAAQS